MRKLWKSAVAVAAFALVAGASDASAQVGISLGGGPSIPIGTFGDVFDMGFNIQASAAFAPAALPFGLRVDGAFNRFGGDEDNFRIVSGSLNGVFNLPTQGIAPYIIGGIGVYNSALTHDDDDDHGHEDHGSTTNVGANVGAGINLPVGGLSLFVEGRFHNIFSEGASTRFIPVTIGVRF